MNLLQKTQLEPKRIRYIHSRHGTEAKMVLIEAVKGAGPWLKVEPAFYVYEKGVEYTAEMKRICGSKGTDTVASGKVFFNALITGE